MEMNSRWKSIVSIEAFFLVIGTAVFIVFTLNPKYFNAMEHFKEPMPWLGFGLTLAALTLLRTHQAKFKDKLALLLRNGSILTGNSLDEVHSNTLRKAVYTFPFVVTTLLLVYLIGLFVAQSQSPHLGLIIGGAVGVYIMSTRFSFGIASAWVIHDLAKNSHFFLYPEHPDKAAGFGHLGYYYLKQAIIILLPTAFMVFWMVSVYFVTSGDFPEEYSANRLEIMIDLYMRCVGDRNTYFWGCPIEKREFIWTESFIALIAFNIIVFTLAWIWPNEILRRKMKESARISLNPVIEKLEKNIRIRRQYALSNPAIQGYDCRELKALASLRSCPLIPLPIGSLLILSGSYLFTAIGAIGVSLKDLIPF